MCIAISKCCIIGEKNIRLVQSRGWRIFIRDVDIAPKDESIKYCPWCGKALEHIPKPKKNVPLRDVIITGADFDKVSGI